MTVDIIRCPADIRFQDGLVLPGVGAFDYGVKMLRSNGLWEAIKDFVNNDKNQLLGICLGMQLLADGSQEGQKPGLGLILDMFTTCRRLLDFLTN